MTPLARVQEAFVSHFPNETTPPRFFQAPGRVNLIGEHTDYNDGFVLPVAIDFGTVVAATPRPDQRIEALAADKLQTDRINLSKPIKARKNMRWANYLRGMLAMLQDAGYTLHGMNLAIAGNVPIGSGLSSSASFELALGMALLSLSGATVDKVELAQLGQKTENDFVGVNCGIMDQFISALGEENHAMLLDCQDLSYQNVPIPPETAIIIVDSGVKRGLVDSEYNARREECETAARHFGAATLRQVDPAEFERQADQLDPVVRRRARHVLTENARTQAAAVALSQGNLTALGPLMAESHLSMRDDFEITVPAIDILTEILQSVEGVYGARMTGGGFGGCCVALAPRGVVPAVAQAVKENYGPKAGYLAKMYVCQASAGARELAV